MVNLTAFVRQNGPHMTLKQLEEESGATARDIRKKCDELGIDPPTTVEVTKRFILCHPNMPVEKMLKVLDCNPIYLQRIYKELGLKIKISKNLKEGVPEEEKEVEEKKIEEIKPKGLSVSQILSSFQAEDAGHYPKHLLKKQ